MNSVSKSDNGPRVIKTQSKTKSTSSSISGLSIQSVFGNRNLFLKKMTLTTTSKQSVSTDPISEIVTRKSQEAQEQMKNENI